MDAEKLLQAFTPEETLEIVAALPTNVIEAEAIRRGIELPTVAGVLAVEQTVELETPETTLTKESLAEQLGIAHKGYSATIEALNSGKRKNKLEVADHETVAKEFEAWFTDDKLEAAKALLELDPDTKFTLVATPNVEATDKDIIKAAKVFGKTMPYETYVYEPIYGKYTAEQLSGTNPDNGNTVQFSLIPNTITPGELSGTVAQQRAKLTELQKENPELKVPSVLEAITFWQTAKAAGEFANGYDWRKTYIRHLNLPEQRIVSWTRVPYSYVSDRGEPALSGSYVGDDTRSRVSVG